MNTTTTNEAMEPKDLAAVVMAAIAIVISLIVPLLTSLRQQNLRRHEKQQALKDKYGELGIGDNVLLVAEVINHYQELQQQHLLWSFVYGAQVHIAGPHGQVSFREFKAACNRTNAYWDSVVSALDQGLVPKTFFKPGGGWLDKADNYRRLFEGLYIADYYRMQEADVAAGKTAVPYLTRGVDGLPAKRPKRYWFIERQSLLHNPGQPQYNTTCWATEYDRQMAAGRQPGTIMITVPPTAPKP